MAPVRPLAVDLREVTAGAQVRPLAVDPGVPGPTDDHHHRPGHSRGRSRRVCEIPVAERPPGGGGDHCSRPEGAGKTTITTAQVSLRDKDLADPSGPAQRVAGAVVVVISMSRRSGSCCGASP